MKLLSAAIAGFESHLIEVEIDLSPGLHNFQIVGLPDAAVKEAKERVSSAIKNTGATPPHHTNRRVIVNLAPADLQKFGSAYDLPIAIAYLAKSGQIKNSKKLESSLLAGELSLDGTLRPVSGALLIAELAKQKKLKSVFLPQQNAEEAALIKNGAQIIPILNLQQLVDFLEERVQIPSQPPTSIGKIPTENPSDDFGFILGQEHAKRALEIAAAGGHNILMSGPPGSGKSLLAKSFVSILPPLSEKEAIEVTKIFSLAGLLPKNQSIIQSRPFRQPHHTASVVSITGGGTRLKPGEISLAHRGVLFMDEIPEFPRLALETLRQPLENGNITVSRASGSTEYPSRFILVAAMNPCPCGYLSDPHKECICSPSQIIKYSKKISGPLLDRIDIHLEVPPVESDKLLNSQGQPESAKIRQRVVACREIQKKRLAEDRMFTNAEMDNRQIKKYCRLETEAYELLKSANQKLLMSARSFFKTIKLGQTIADLENAKKIKPRHIAEALQYRRKADSATIYR